MPCLQEWAYDSDPAVPTRSPDSSAAISTHHEYSLARCRTNSLAEAKGDVWPEAPIYAENITFQPRGPPSAITIRRLRLLR